MTEAKRYWQSVADYNGELPAARDDEFPEGYFDEQEGFLATNRRGFLKMMGLGLSAGVLASCSNMPVKKAIPYLSKPEEITPGVPVFYASTCGACSASCGVLVKTRDGRPIKLEGNPLNPLTERGGLCASGQGHLLSLYLDNRLRGPQKGESAIAWADLDAQVVAALTTTRLGGKGVAVISSTVTSPSLLRLIQEFVQATPGSRHVTYDAVSSSALRAAQQRFGKAVLPAYRFDLAKVIVSFDADFLGTWISPVEFTGQYASGRKAESGEMSTHIQFETGMSVTGSNADTRVPVSAAERSALVSALYQVLSGDTPVFPDTFPDTFKDTVIKTAALLKANKGASLVVSGSNDVAEQVLIAEINALLGNYGKTLDVTAPSFQKQGDDRAFLHVLTDLEAGKLGAVVILGANPAYDAPDAARFVAALKAVPLVVSLAGTRDETAALAHYIAPDHHALESWGDAAPRAGVYSLKQPAMAPLFDTRSVYETLLTWMGRSETADTYLKAYWQAEVFPLQSGMASFTAFWNRALHDGVFVSAVKSIPQVFEIASAQAAASSVAPPVAAKAIEAAHAEAATAKAKGLFEVSLYERIGVGDGAHAGNPWLQELPDPVARVSWTNFAAMSPASASALGILHGDEVSLTADQVSVTLPVYIQPGQANGTVSVALGYGRACGEKVYGANAYPFQSVQSVNDGGVSRDRRFVAIQKTGKQIPFAAMQTENSQHKRPIVLEATLAEFKKDASVFTSEHEIVSMWDRHEKKGHSWGMVIDLGSCTGCNACVIACQAENNIPVVGEEEIRRNRDMYWMRIDRYFSDSPDAPQTVYQPMLCQHCENAPCETVCPVLATLHSSEGLNMQVYNRCVGTRYCANNCPYKVRRFNWFNYTKDGILDDDLAHMVLNPDVTVRTRGVMEKCSMCVQRVNAGKLTARLGDRLVKDGDIQVACEQSCPADAITFGDLNDPSSRVSRLGKSARNYRVLEELGVKPAVSYLGKIRNPRV